MPVIGAGASAGASLTLGPADPIAETLVRLIHLVLAKPMRPAGVVNKLPHETIPPSVSDSRFFFGRIFGWPLRWLSRSPPPVIAAGLVQDMVALRAYPDDETIVMHQPPIVPVVFFLLVQLRRQIPLQERHVHLGERHSFRWVA